MYFLCVMMEKGKVRDESGECEGKGEMVESGLKRVGESGREGRGVKRMR